MRTYVSTAAALLLLLVGFTKAAFYDCHKELGGLSSDQDALAKVKAAHQTRFKFSSECLEVLLKKNFFLSSEYLIDDYYTKTSIDTEVIVRNVAADLKRSQDHLIFQVKKREKKGEFPQAKPVVYWAQSTTDALIMVRLHTQMDTPDCRQSFEREVVIEEDRIRVQTYCYENEENIKMFDTEDIELKQNIVPEQSSYEWRGDGKVAFTLRKSNGPSFWKYLLRDPVKEAKELQVWWEQRDKHIEQLEEYMFDDSTNSKDDL